MSGKKTKTGKADKALSLFIVAVLFLSAIPLIVSANDDIIELTESFNFSEPQIIENGNFVDIEIDDLSKMINSREPMLPEMNKRVLELPMGSTIEDVTFTHSSMNTINIGDKKVTPGPIPMVNRKPIIDINNRVILNSILSKIISRIAGDTFQYPSERKEVSSSIDKSIYESDDVYGESFSYRTFIGMNKNNKRSLILVVDIVPCTYSPSSGKLHYFTSGEVTVTYKPATASKSSTGDEGYDLLILTPNQYKLPLRRLVTHKEEMGLRTKLVTLNEIYDDTYFKVPEGMKIRDNQEHIKYFIYRSLFPTDFEDEPGPGWDVTYVMAVGGYRTFLGFNNPNQQFPIRHNQLDDGEGAVGFATDLYYSCCINATGDFDTWDTDNDGVIGEPYHDTYDPFIDVYFGREACRNIIEVRDRIDKIIHYETETYGQDWFKKAIMVSGDAFQDGGSIFDSGWYPLQTIWDTNNLPDGEYKMYAQTHTDDLFYGPIDMVNITIDRTAPTVILFGEEDHLKIEKLDPNQNTMYPGKPVAEICIPNEDSILGNTDDSGNPEEAYCSDLIKWAEYSYEDGILTIITKSYNPTPVNPSLTHVRVWVNNSDDEIVFGPAFPLYEGEEAIYEYWWEGELSCDGGANKLPDDFEISKIYTSNGNWFNMSDILKAYSEGSGFMYFDGHSSCMSWGDHTPAVPGGRHNAMVDGISAINLKYTGLERYQGAEGDPLFPIEELSNGNNLPVVLFSGCHSGQFDTSLMKAIYEPNEVLLGARYGTWVPEGMAWWMTRLADGGSIAIIGNTALGSGYLGGNAPIGLVGWIYPRFLYNYVEGYDNVGAMHAQTMNDYIQLNHQEGGVLKRHTFEMVNLLGDPSLKIGGYPTEAQQAKQVKEPYEIEISFDESGAATIKNTGSRYITLDGEIFIEGDSPLGEFLGGSELLLKLFMGRVFNDGLVNITDGLSPGESIIRSSDTPFGIGHINVAVILTIDEDPNENVFENREDGFLIGSRMLLIHGRE